MTDSIEGPYNGPIEPSSHQKGLIHEKTVLTGQADGYGSDENYLGTLTPSMKLKKWVMKKPTFSFYRRVPRSYLSERP